MRVGFGELAQGFPFSCFFESFGKVFAVLLRQFFKGGLVGIILVGQAEITEIENVVGRVGYEHRNRIVLADDCEQEFKVGIDVGLGKALGCAGPYVHSFALLLRELLHKAVAHQQKQDDGEN